MKSLFVSFVQLFIIFVVVFPGNSLPLNSYTNPVNFQTYPFTQWIQVRKQITYEHVPYSDLPENEMSVDSTNHNKNNNDQTHSSSNYPELAKPYLSHEIFTHKNQEVYEEKGYLDSEYDHQVQRHEDATGSDTKLHSIKSEEPKNTSKFQDGSSSKILEHIANNHYDEDAHKLGIYRASHQKSYCPEVTDFKMKDGASGRPRQIPGRGVTGLRSKMNCIKLMYFGNNPLPSTIFHDPEKSDGPLIQMGSMEDFMKSTSRF